METKIRYEIDALDYIAKVADGHMRDALTLLDKCLAYSKELTLENVTKALGTVDYDIMFKLTDKLISNKLKDCIDIIEDIHASGKEIKQFILQYTKFILDITKYCTGCGWEYLSIPKLPDYEAWISACGSPEFEICYDILDMCVRLNNTLKFSQSPKADVEAEMLLTFRSE